MVSFGDYSKNQSLRFDSMMFLDCLIFWIAILYEIIERAALDHDYSRDVNLYFEPIET
jgi:hypothetical protein